MEKETQGFPKMIRLLSLFERLAKGEAISKAEEAARFGVDLKSIQRDIDDLREYFQEFWKSPSVLAYYRAEKGYRLDRQFQTGLTAKEILLISKVLLESRCMKKDELAALLVKLAGVCEPAQNKNIQEVLRNEQFHYYPVRQGEDLMGRVWELSQAVRERRLVDLTYGKERGDQAVRTVEPVGVVFSEYYFYLVANIHGFQMQKS